LLKIFSIAMKDFMSTQTGGEGQTLQMSPSSSQLPSDFEVNIPPVNVEAPSAPQPQPINSVEAPITKKEVINEVVDNQIAQSIDNSVAETTVDDNPLGLTAVDVPTYDSLFPAITPKESPILESEQSSMLAKEEEVLSTSTGIPMYKQNIDSMLNIQPSIPESETENLTPNYSMKTSTGIPMYDLNQENRVQIEKTNLEYKGTEASISPDNKVKLAPVSKGDPIKQGVVYRLPGGDDNYKFESDGWYKDANGKGSWIKLADNKQLEKRTKFLNENAVYFKTVKPNSPGSEAIYNIPGSAVKYKRVNNKWLRETENGTYKEISQGDVAKRTAYLNKVAKPVSSTVMDKASALVVPSMGELRVEDENKLLTGGGDAVVADGASFQSLTRGNQGSESEPFNQDGTKNFNYDPKTENPLYIKGKEDGFYAIKGSSNSYKKENGKWYAAVKGSKEYRPITTGNIEERINQLELKAFKPVKISEASALYQNNISSNLIANPIEASRKIVSDFSKDVLGSGEAKKLADAETSFNNASEFVKKDINLILKDNLNETQKSDIQSFQSQVKEIIGNGEYTTAKALAVSKVMKQAETYFDEAKTINKEINEAFQEGKSLSRVSFDKKLASYKDNLGAGGAISQGDYQEQSVALFEATSEMASFIIDNVDNGNMRFDNQTKKYLFSPNISQKEKTYLEEKLNGFITEYDAIQKEKYAQTNQKVQEHKNKLSALYTNIDKIEKAISIMEKDGVSADDAMYKSYIALLKQEKGKIPVLKSMIHKTEMSKSTVFLTKPKSVAAEAAKNLSSDSKTILSAIPKDITPKQRFDLFYERLMAQNDKIAVDNDISTTGLGLVNQSLKDLLDWEGFYSLSKAEKRYLKNQATLNQLAPLYYNNDIGITEEETGFFESFMNSFYTSLFPNKAAALGYVTQSTAAATIDETLAREGYGPDDFVDENVIGKLKEKAVVDTLSSKEGWGRMFGSTAAVVSKLVLTKGVPASSTKFIVGMEKLLLGKNSAIALELINNASKVYNATLKSTKIGRFIAPAVEQGISFERAGRLMGGDDLYFAAGFAGGIASELFVGLTDKLPKEQMYAFISNIFGSKTNVAVQALVKSGKMAAQGTAETAEEFTEELTNIYRDTDNFKEMMVELSNRFGAFDQVQEFVVSSFIMGAGFGLANNSQTQKALDTLSPEKKAATIKVLAEINNDINTAKNAKDEFVSNKLEQESIEKTAKEDDKKDKTGVSGEVAKGEESIQAEPIVEASQEAPSLSGVVQETPIEVTPTTVKATSLEEATKLFNEGYRPVINGKVQEGNLVGLEALFNTMPEVEMQKETKNEAISTPLTAEETAGKEEVESSTGIITTKNPIKILKGLFGKRNADGSVRTAHPDVKGTWGALDENIAKRYKGDEEKTLTEFSIPAGTTVETIEIPDTNIPVSELRQAETDAVNSSTAQVVRLITMDSGSSKKESQIIIKDANLAKVPEATTTAEEIITPEERISLADKIRSGKIGVDGMAMSSIPGFKEAWNISLEIVAKAVEGGASIANAISQGFDEMQKSKWYVNLTKEQKTQAFTDYDKAINERAAKKRISKAERDAAKEFKGRVDEATGTLKPDKVVLLTSSAALKEYIKAQDKAAKTTIKDLQAVKAKVARYITETLPSDKYSKTEIRVITSALEKADFKNVDKIIDRVDRLVAKKQKQRVVAKANQIKEIIKNKKTLFAKKGTKWIGKGTIESQEEYMSFVDGIDVDTLTERTEEELDAIIEIIDGIVTTGIADKRILVKAEEKASRKRAALLIMGLAGEPDAVLNSLSEAEAFINDGGTVIINGEAFSKSTLKEFSYAYNKQNKLGEDLEKAENDLTNLSEQVKERVSEMISSGISLDSNKELISLQKQLDTAKRKRDNILLESSKESKAIEITEPIYAYEYQSSNLARISSDNLSKNKLMRLALRGKAIVNPFNAMNNIYSLLKDAGVKNSNVYKFVQERISKPISDAYFNRNENYANIVATYNQRVDEIFGKNIIDKKGEKGVRKLGAILDAEQFLTSKTAKNFPLTNGHIVDWYNLSLTRNGAERLTKSKVNVEAVQEYMALDENKDLKEYSDFIMESYKLAGLNYESTFESVTGTKFPKDKEYPYYPSYSESYQIDAVNENSLLNGDGTFRSMDAMSKNMEQRTDFSGTLNLSIDAHTKFLDYIKTMEHAKQFLPVAKSVNELFSRANTPYLIDKMGTRAYNELRTHLSVILSNQPVSSFNNTTSKGMGWLLNLQVLTTLGLKPASVIKQFSSFTHYWVAGIDEGLNPLIVMTSIPKSKEEILFASKIMHSNYVKDRFSGEGLDYELKRLQEEAKTSKASKAFRTGAKASMIFVRAGDISVMLGPGGGIAYAIAMRNLKISQGMSVKDAESYAYKSLVKETESVMQTSREDETSNVQRDPIYRMIATYRTAQTAVVKRIINGFKVLDSAKAMQKNEGIEARREAISDRDMTQAATDIIYYSLLSSIFFYAVSSGALAMYSSMTDDEKKRVKFDLAAEQGGSLLQGLGFMGLLIDHGINYSRGNVWKNMIPVVKYMTSLTSLLGSYFELSNREFKDLEKSDKTKLLNEEMGVSYAQTQEAMDKMQAVIDDFNSSIAWAKMTESESDAAIKTVGLGNAQTFKDNLYKWIDGDKETMDVIMNYDDDYFQKARESGREDHLYQWLMDEPYISPKMKSISTPDLITGDEIKVNDLVPNLVAPLSNTENPNRRKKATKPRFN
jgi:hypothetical protein